MRTIAVSMFVTFMTVMGLNGVYEAAQQDPIPHHYEDDDDWSCVDDGNRVCGPNNPEGQPAGCYDIGGVMIASWPCSPWKDETK